MATSPTVVTPITQIGSVPPTTRLPPLTRSASMASKFPEAYADLEWTKKRSNKGLHPYKKTFDPHVAGYSGHQPRNWWAHEPHKQESMARTASCPQLNQKRKVFHPPKQAATASKGSGPWYGYAGDFPSE